MIEGQQPLTGEADAAVGLRAVFDAIDEGACLVERLPAGPEASRNYRYLAINPAMRAMFGMGDLTGQTIRDTFPREAEACYDAYDRVLASGKPMRFERERGPHGMVLAVSVSPLKGAPGQLLIVMQDITQRRRAEEALARSEQRMHALLRASSDMIYRMSADWSEMRELQGREMLADTQGSSVRWLEDYIFPEDQPMIRAATQEALRRGGTFELEHRVKRADGSAGWVFSRAIPQFDADGALVEWFGMASDITARVEAQQQAEAARATLAESEALLSKILDASSDCIKLIELDGTLGFINEGGMRTAEIADLAQVKGTYWPDYMATPESRDLARVALLAALAGETSQFEGAGLTLLGRPRWWHVTVSPLMDESGAVGRILVVSRDHTAMRDAHEHQAMLNGELSHRLKNLLSLVQSIVSQTLRHAAGLEDASAKIASRMLALAQATDGLTSSAWKEGSLSETIGAGLCCVSAYGERIALSGPDLRIGAQVALALTLTVHELATNAVKYGALSHEGGRITLCWAVEERALAYGGVQQHFLLDWQEHGGPLVHPPQHRGFGSRMIERVLLAHMTGRLHVDYAPEGLHFSVDTPLADLAGPSALPQG
ncbi:PAS domain-containing protein [Novosphingobium terrae]|uniref:PAS domain-containing protein n=1 Tax=Novosphingobium terrae TaxID=2726189 RepID=UPI00197F794C|nr:PAS domain-containing protein [Novosphingobium terrae]